MNLKTTVSESPGSRVATGSSVYIKWSDQSGQGIAPSTIDLGFSQEWAGEDRILTTVTLLLHTLLEGRTRTMGQH